MSGQGKYWDYLILGRVLCPHQGDTVSPNRGLNDTGDILDIRKGVAADSQQKTAFENKENDKRRGGAFIWLHQVFLPML